MNATTQFTYYCYEHRDERRTGGHPADLRHVPVCERCFKLMHWVPSGGTVVPEAPTTTKEVPDGTT